MSKGSGRRESNEIARFVARVARGMKVQTHLPKPTIVSALKRHNVKASVFLVLDDCDMEIYDNNGRELYEVKIKK